MPIEPTHSVTHRKAAAGKIMTAQSESATRSQIRLEVCEWNFDAVPKGELVACCYWEYARESAFIRQLRKRCRENWQAGGPGDDALYADLDKVQSIGYASEVFLSGFFFNETEDRKPRHPQAPVMTGSFPSPWQALSEAERSCRSPIRRDVDALTLTPFAVAHWSSGRQ